MGHRKKACRVVERRQHNPALTHIQAHTPIVIVSVSSYIGIVFAEQMCGKAAPKGPGLRTLPLPVPGM